VLLRGKFSLALRGTGRGTVAFENSFSLARFHLVGVHRLDSKIVRVFVNHRRITYDHFDPLITRHRPSYFARNLHG
jgi:hypothetical protein